MTGSVEFRDSVPFPNIFLMLFSRSLSSVPRSGPRNVPMFCMIVFLLIPLAKLVAFGYRLLS